MRPSQDRRNNRQNNQRRNSNQNRMPVHSRQFESAGPGGKVKGTPKQLIEKYMGLARDYYSSGDDINAETCKQFAEHYSRLLGNHHTKPAQPHSNTDKTEKPAEKTDSNKIEIEVIEGQENALEKEERPARRRVKKEIIKAEEVEANHADEEKVEAEKPKRRGRPKKKEEEENRALELPLEDKPEDKPKRRGRPKKAEAVE